MSNPQPIIEVRDLSKTIDSGSHRVEILKGIDLIVPRGQFVAVMGPSGSGKSTLLGLLAGLDAPSSGQILLDGQEITHLGEDEMAVLRGRKIGFVFQSYQLVPTLTAEENVLLPLDLGVDGHEGAARTRELLESVGLSDRLDHYPVQLSGGEQQRVALARAFVPQPDVLLADEPTGNLDGETGGAVMGELFRMRAVGGSTLILVTHDHALAARCDRMVHIADGRIVAPAEV